jgi:glycosyltransferase involved in cell wall biosynthesis
MTHPRRYWLALHPDIRKPIGGAKQMHRFAEALTRCGRQATLIQERADFHPGWFDSQVNTIALSDWRQRTDLDPRRDVVVLPETFLPVVPRYGQGLPKLLFNQNGAYSFGIRDGDGFPDTAEAVLNLYSHSDLAHVLCVSLHDQQLLEQGFRLGPHRVSRLINAIETDVFRPGVSNKKKVLSFMPRKNSHDAAIVAALLRSQSWFAGWTLQPIEGLPQAEVAQRLQRSLGFLAFGHPEGFGLPLAEAAACGCALIGYSGLGGRELMAMACHQQVGWEVDYGDWQGFLDGTKALIRAVQERPQTVVSQLQALSEQVRQRYVWTAMVKSVEKALPRWESQLPV